MSRALAVLIIAAVLAPIPTQAQTPASADKPFVVEYYYKARWGYAEEFSISRNVVDAQVLPIFEGVKPILELKVIARQLLAA